MCSVKVERVGHVPGKTLINEKEVHNVTQRHLVEVVAPAEPAAAHRDTV